MTKYNVTHPIAGLIWVEVEADSVEEAIARAPEAWCELSGEEQEQQIEWDFLTRISEGNVLYAPLNEADAEEVDRHDKED